MDPFATITEMVDSAGHKADTLLEAEVKEEPKPMEADEQAYQASATIHHHRP